MALSQTALEFARDLRYRGSLVNATHYGVGGTPGEGPYFQLWLEIERGSIVEISFRTHGCPSSLAVASALCRLVQGRELSRAQSLHAADLQAFLGPLPEGKEFNWGLAEEALRSIQSISEQKIHAK